ncbi:MAG: PAS domain S-box protein [Chloroflexota bacterium]|nr:PAS domain S-box protein [Chloroflexota bacterium]
MATGDAILGSHVKQVLEGEGFQVSCEASGESIITRVAENDRVLLLLDCHLADLSAVELIESLREGQCLPFTLVMVDKGEPRTIVDLMRMGVEACILKSPGFIERLPKDVKRMMQYMHYAKAIRDVDEVDRLDQNQKLLQVVAETMSAGLCICTDTGRVVAANMEYLRLTGRDFLEEILNHSLLEWAAIYDVERIMEALEQLLHHGIVRDFDIDYVHPNGNTMPISIGAGTMNTGDERRFFAICTDMTKQRQLELELLREMNTAQRYLDVAGVMFIVISNEGEVTQANSKACQVLGYRIDEIIGKNWFENFLPERIRDGVMEVFHQLMLGEIEPVEYFENPVLTSCGYERIIAWHNTVLRDQSNNIVGTLSSGEDITDKKKDKESLQKSEEKYSAIVENCSDVIVIVKDHKIVYINEKAVRILGYAVEDIYGEPIERLIAPEFQKNEEERCRHHCIEDEKSSLWEMDVVAKGGSFIPMEVVSTSIEYEDEPAEVLFLRDISERRITQEKIGAEEEKRRVIVDNIEEGLFSIDKAGIITYSNPKACRISGYTLEELIGLPISQLVSLERHDFMIAKFLDTIEGDTQYFESRMLKKDGRTAPVEITVTPLKRNGELVEVIGMVRDITERKTTESMLKQFADDVASKNQQLEVAESDLAALNRDLENKIEERTAEVQQLLQQKEELLHRLGHDLKSPLTPIITLLPIVKRHEVDYEQKEMLDVAVQSAEYMQDLVIKILKLARLDSISSPLQLEDLSLLHEVNSVLGGKHVVANEKGVVIENEVGQDFVVRADKLGLQEVVDNLVGNALKFVQKDGVITIKASQKNGSICVSVNDTGIGMNEEQLSHVFDEFYKADESRGELRSTGLGLSICKRIVEKHGGTIWVESLGLGKGSCFYFTLSAGDPNALAPADKMDLSGRSTMWSKEDVHSVL